MGDKCPQPFVSKLDLGWPLPLIHTHPPSAVWANVRIELNRGPKLSVGGTPPQRNVSNPVVKTPHVKNTDHVKYEDKVNQNGTSSKNPVGKKTREAEVLYVIIIIPS